MFHVKNGLCFGKLPDGGVEIYNEGEVPNFTIQLTASEWASVIATMSYYGEEDYGFYRALNFHTGAPIDPVTTPLKEKNPFAKGAST